MNNNNFDQEDLKQRYGEPLNEQTFEAYKDWIDLRPFQWVAAVGLAALLGIGAIINYTPSSMAVENSNTPIAMQNNLEATVINLDENVEVYIKMPIQRTVVVAKKTEDRKYEMTVKDLEKLEAYKNGEPMTEEVPLEFLEEVLESAPKIKAVDEDMVKFMREYQQNKRAGPKLEIGTIYDISNSGGGEAPQPKGSR